MPGSSAHPAELFDVGCAGCERVFGKRKRRQSESLSRRARGKIVAQASKDKDELLVSDLDMDMIREVRDLWQFFRDRRPESYGGLTEQR